MKAGPLERGHPFAALRAGSARYVAYPVWAKHLRKAVWYAQLGSASRVPVILYAFDSRPLNFDLSRQTVNIKHLPSEVKRE
jgi:hypothetical protein